jgi:outer membrane protein
MNKAVFFVLFFLNFSTHAVFATENSISDDAESTALIGLGPYFQTQPYKDADPKLLPTPVIFFDNRLFYVRWTRIGMYVYGKQNWGISLTAQPRVFGYRARDSASLSAMSERHPTWEGGVAVGGQNSQGFAELTYFHDLLNYSNGFLVRLEIGKTISQGRWTHIPSFYIIRYSSTFNNYYYGVRPEERLPQRPAYHANAGVNYALQDFAIIELSKKWYISADLRADYLASEVTRSPIVGDQWMLSGMLALMYKVSF